MLDETLDLNALVLHRMVMLTGRPDHRVQEALYCDFRHMSIAKRYDRPCMTVRACSIFKTTALGRVTTSSSGGDIRSISVLEQRIPDLPLHTARVEYRSVDREDRTDEETLPFKDIATDKRFLELGYTHTGGARMHVWDNVPTLGVMMIMPSLKQGEA
jgi:hypothetical protein